MKVLDLCSGLGGFSQAFVDAGHEVLRIENNPLLSDVPHTHIIDIFEVRDLLEDIASENPDPFFHDIDLVLFSPPCYEFSLAFNAPRATHIRENSGIEYFPSMDLLECGLDIINLLSPRYYIVENVRGATKYFKEFLGDPRQINDAYVLWGNFPSFCPGNFPSKGEKDKRHSPMRANIVAKIPIQLSKALLEAVESQKSIFEYA